MQSVATSTAVLKCSGRVTCPANMTLPCETLNPASAKVSSSLDRKHTLLLTPQEP